MTDTTPGQPIFSATVRGLLWPFLLLAAAGFTASLVVNVLGWAGVDVPGSAALHLGIFVVWVPAVLAAQRLAAGRARSDFWKAALRHGPPWADKAVKALFAYGVGTFLLGFVLSSAHRGPASDGGLGRVGSSIWMIFYGAATLLLHSAIHAVDDRPRCPSGHLASPGAAFCERCGAALPAAPAPRALVR